MRHYIPILTGFGLLLLLSNAEACDDCQQQTVFAPAVQQQSFSQQNVITQRAVTIPGAITTQRIPQPPMMVAQPDLLVTTQAPDTTQVVTESAASNVCVDAAAANPCDTTGLFSDLRKRFHQGAARRHQKAAFRHNVAARTASFQSHHSNAWNSSINSLASSGYTANSWSNSSGYAGSVYPQLALAQVAQAQIAPPQMAQPAPPQGSSIQARTIVDIDGNTVLDETTRRVPLNPGPQQQPQQQPQSVFPTPGPTTTPGTSL